MKRSPPQLHDVRVLWPKALAAGLAVAMAPAFAQQAPQAIPQPAVKEVAAPLPSVEELAAALATPGMREQVLLASAALAAQSPRRGGPNPDDAAAAGDRLLRDRDWLEALRTRFGPAEPHSPVLDPAAWRLRVQIERHGLDASSMYSARGPEMDALLAQAFDRGSPRLAAAALPELLWRMEAGATVVLDDLLRQAEGDARMASLLAAFGEVLPIPATDPPELLSPDGLRDLAAQSLLALAGEVADVGPPDVRRLWELCYQLLAAMPGIDGPERQAAGIALHLALLLDGLNTQRYFRFVEGLLGSAAQLESIDRLHPGRVKWLAMPLVELLPVVSSRYSRAFASVDPRLNSALAAAFDVLRNLARPDGAPGGAPATPQLADAVAKLALLVPDMDFYFGLPVRDPVAGVVDACTGIAASREPDGSPAMTRELFDDCQQSLLELVGGEARETQLSGDPDGPFGESNLQRELNLTYGQRINYGIGYLHDRYSTGCVLPQRELPNPLEWAFLATFMAWLAEQSPVYFQTPENEQRLLAMRNAGQELVQALAEQVDCFAGAGAGVNDPVLRVTNDYRQALLELSSGLRQAEDKFRAQFLAPGADVALDGDAGQSTAYRPAQVVIGPCDPERVCEMSGQLSSTRALLGLFPDPYLLADQTGLGRIEICYDRMEWVDRRSEPVRAGDENVANYYGHLAFDVRGRYLGQGEPVDLFAFRFRSPEEQHYMFAAASEEVLNDSCPMEWIGQRIITTLPEGRRGIVPNRLTYLAAARTRPSQLLSRNWDRGAEWRDWFVTGIGVKELPVPPLDDPTRRLDQHLQSLYRLEQKALYEILLEAMPDADYRNLTPLQDELTGLTTRKAMVRAQMMLFYPQAPRENDVFRAAVAGQGGLLDAQVLMRFRADNVPVAQVADIAYERLEWFEGQWRAQPESVRRSGSVDATVAHALTRLSALNTRYFASPPEPEGSADERSTRGY